MIESFIVTGNDWHKNSWTVDSENQNNNIFVIRTPKPPVANNGSQPMRVSEGSQASAPACRHLCQRTGTQARNPALAVAANVSYNQTSSDSASVIFY